MMMALRPRVEAHRAARRTRLHREPEPHERLEDPVDRRPRHPWETAPDVHQELIGRGMVGTPGQRLVDDAALHRQRQPVTPAGRLQVFQAARRLSLAHRHDWYLVPIAPCCQSWRRYSKDLRLRTVVVVVSDVGTSAGGGAASTALGHSSQQLLRPEFALKTQRCPGRQSELREHVISTHEPGFGQRMRALPISWWHVVMRPLGAQGPHVAPGAEHGWNVPGDGGSVVVVTTSKRVSRPRPRHSSQQFVCRVAGLTTHRRPAPQSLSQTHHDATHASGCAHSAVSFPTCRKQRDILLDGGHGPHSAPGSPHPWNPGAHVGGAADGVTTVVEVVTGGGTYRDVDVTTGARVVLLLVVLDSTT